MDRLLGPDVQAGGCGARLTSAIDDCVQHGIRIEQIDEVGDVRRIDRRVQVATIPADRCGHTRTDRPWSLAPGFYWEVMGCPGLPGRRLTEVAARCGGRRPAQHQYGGALTAAERQRRGGAANGLAGRSQVVEPLVCTGPTRLRRRSAPPGCRRWYVRRAVGRRSPCWLRWPRGPAGSVGPLSYSVLVEPLSAGEADRGQQALCFAVAERSVRTLTPVSATTSQIASDIVAPLHATGPINRAQHQRRFSPERSTLLAMTRL